MQPFIKIGSRYVNTAMITDVFVQDQRPERPEVHVEVYLAATTGERSTSTAPANVQARRLHVSGAEADALIRWLDTHATPVADAE